MKTLILASAATLLFTGAAHAQLVPAPLPQIAPMAPSVGATVEGRAEGRVDAQANGMRGRTRTDRAPAAVTTPGGANGGGQQAPVTENGTAPTREPTNTAVPDVPQQRPQQETRTPADPAPTL